MCECREEHEAIQAEVHEVHQTLEFHTAEVHNNLVTRDEAKQWHDRTDAQMEELASAVLGPRKTEFAGGGRDEEEGLVWQWHHYTTNGGIPSRLGGKERAGIWMAVIAGVTGIIVQVIEHLPFGS